MEVSRIPGYDCTHPDGMLSWFCEMSARNLIFHPEDVPRDIRAVATGRRTFTDRECAELEFILADMFERHGDAVCETAFRVIAARTGILAALDA
jgi:hypothetical protein